MAKLSITRLLEISRYLATDAGRQLQDLLVFLTDLAEQVIRALRNGLTYSDNFNCQVSTVSLVHGVSQIVSSGGKIPGNIHHATQSTKAAISSLIWYANSSNQLIVTPIFTDTTGALAPGTYTVTLTLIFN